MTQLMRMLRFQRFTCIATARTGTGSALFSSSHLFFQHLSSPYALNRLESIKWPMANDGFWHTRISDLPLVVRHPIRNFPYIRWHEPRPASKTTFSSYEV